MDTVENNEEIEIDLKELLLTLKAKWKFIALTTIIVGIVAGAFTIGFIDKKYSSTSRIYLKPKVTEGMVDYSTVNSNDKMVNNYVEIMKGDTILSAVAGNVGVENSVVKEALSVGAETNTQIIKVTATTTDAGLSQAIVQNTIDVFYREMQTTLQIDNIAILDEAKINETPVSPSLTKNIAIGVLLGLVGSCGVVFVQFMLDTRIKNKDQVEQYLGVPALGVVPWYKD